MKSKLNKLLQNVPPGTVLLSSWMVKNGYSRELQHRYLKSGWLESIGAGAMKRSGDSIDLFGAMHSLQVQAKKKLHIGGRSALALQGLSHYLEISQKETIIFGPNGSFFPNWMKQYQWETSPVLIKTDFLPSDSGLVEYPVKTFSLKISSPVRAILECLHLCPGRFDLYEAWQIMEALTSLRPLNVQQLLESSNSVKVNRLFLFLAEKANHPWLKHLHREKIKLGSGSRSIYPGGVFIPAYKITVPQNLI